MAVDIKTVEFVQHRFPTQVLLMLFYALVMSHLDYFLLFFFKISSSLLLSLGKQMNWALKTVFFCINIKSSYESRKNKGIISIRPLIMFKSPIYFFQYIIDQKKSFQNQLKLPTTSNRWNSRNNQVIYIGNFLSVSTSYSFFFHYTSLKWNSLPLHMRDPSVSLHVVKSRIKFHLENVKCSSYSNSLYLAWFPIKLTCVFFSQNCWWNSRNLLMLA